MSRSTKEEKGKGDKIGRRWGKCEARGASSISEEREREKVTRKVDDLGWPLRLGPV
jgi:hypothetical protein